MRRILPAEARAFGTGEAPSALAVVDPQEPGWLVVIDLLPLANLSHPHRWVWITEGGAISFQHGWPPDEGVSTILIGSSEVFVDGENLADQMAQCCAAADMRTATGRPGGRGAEETLLRFIERAGAEMEEHASCRAARAGNACVRNCTCSLRGLREPRLDLHHDPGCAARDPLYDLRAQIERIEGKLDLLLDALRATRTAVDTDNQDEWRHR